MKNFKILITLAIFTVNFIIIVHSAGGDVDDPRETTVKELIDRIEFDVLTKIQKEYIPRKNFCPRTFTSPNTNKTSATHVFVSVFIRDIRIEYVNKGLSYWTVDLIMRQKWNNPRLAYNIADYPDYDYATVNSIRLMWVPDLFFPDEVKRESSSSIGSGSGSVQTNNILLWVYPNGDVLHSYRVPSLTLRCRHQTGSVTKLICPLTIGSYGCTTKKLLLEWDKVNPVEVDLENLYMPFYSFGGNNKTVTKEKEEVTRIGNFSRIQADLQFSRVD